MNIHNITEDKVLALVHEICESLEQRGNPDKLCTCSQCRLDIACYVLNRSEPHYVVSNRGVARVDLENFGRQQTEADIIIKIHEGIKKVNNIQRPFFDHNAEHTEKQADSNKPVFNIPTIIGRVFNGMDFSPMPEGIIELRRDGELIPMKDLNWQNPYILVKHTAGTFTLWPAPVEAEKEGRRETFSYSLKISVKGFEDLDHFFSIPVLSDQQAAGSFSMQRTFKLPDLYMFPPGEEQDRCVDDGN